MDPIHAALRLSLRLSLRIQTIQQERDTALAQLAECYRLTGADPSGGMTGDVNEDWRLAQYAVEEVRRLRAECDEAQASEDAAALAKALDLLDLFADDDDCRMDHNGYCQEHNLGKNKQGGCRMKDVWAFLEQQGLR